MVVNGKPLIIERKPGPVPQEVIDNLKRELQPLKEQLREFLTGTSLGWEVE